RSDDFSIDDLDAESFQTHEVALALGPKADRGNPQVLQDLRAQPDFPPFGLALDGLGMAFAIRDPVPAIFVRDADRALAQIDEDSPSLLAHPLGDLLRQILHAENIRNHVFPVQAHRNVLTVADIAENDGEMLHRLPWQRVSKGGRRASGGLDGKARMALDELFLALPVGDQVGHRNLPQTVLFRESV